MKNNIIFPITFNILKTITELKFKLDLNLSNIQLNTELYKNNISFWGYIAYIEIENDFIVIFIKEDFPIFLINNTIDYNKDLNQKNVVYKFIRKMMNNIFDNSKFKIKKIELKKININIKQDFYYINFAINLKSIYTGQIIIILKKNILLQFLKNIYPDSINLQSIINSNNINYTLSKQNLYKKINFIELFDLKNTELQNFINILLQNNICLYNLAQIVYVYPELENKIKYNLSKNNIKQFEKIKIDEDKKDLEIIINHNFQPRIIEIIKKYNIKNIHLYKLNKLLDLYELYTLQTSFYSYPFSLWLKKILQSDNLLFYTNYFLKKENLLALIDEDKKIVESLFKSYPNRVLNNILEDIKILKSKKIDLVQILKSKQKLVDLIKNTEISDKTKNYINNRFIELISKFETQTSIDYFIRQIKQDILFNALYDVDKKIINLWYKSFSKNMKKDFEKHKNYRILQKDIYNSKRKIIDTIENLIKGGKIAYVNRNNR